MTAEQLHDFEAWQRLHRRCVIHRGFILLAGKLPAWHGMPRAAKMKERAGHPLSWEQYAEAGALATPKEVREWLWGTLSTGSNNVGLPPSFIPLGVLDVDVGDWRRIARMFPPLAVSKTPGLDKAGKPKNDPWGCRHLWYRPPESKPRGTFEFLGVAGESRARAGGYVALHEGAGPPLAALDRLGDAGPGDWPSFALAPTVTRRKPPPVNPDIGGRPRDGREAYFKAVLRNALAEIAAGSEGIRHATMRDKAHVVAGYWIGCGKPGHAKVYQNLILAAFVRVAGDKRRGEGVRTIKGAWERGVAAPLYPPE